MIILDKKGLLSYKDSLLVSFTPKFNTTYQWENKESVLGNIYACIMQRKYSGTAQEKVDIALMAKNELKHIFKQLKY